MAEKKILTIDRSKWRRGGDGEDLRAEFGFTYLLNGHSGRMCCLGFDAIACGIDAVKLDGQADPSDLDLDGEVYGEYLSKRVTEERSDWDDSYSTALTAAARRAVSYNDDPGIDEQTRESEVREALIALGWDDVVFIEGGDAQADPAIVKPVDGSQACGSALPDRSSSVTGAFPVSDPARREEPEG